MQYFSASHFNTPPNWPQPSAGWRPQWGWEPGPDWPPAPAGWSFWIDDRGRAVSGPIGAYGAQGAGRLEVATAFRSLLLL